MTSWLDHLSSTLVLSVAVLIIAGVFALRSENAIRGTSLFNAQVMQRSFTEQMQIDLDNLGVGRPAGTVAVVEQTADRFAFYTAIDTMGQGGLVVYERLDDGGGLSRVRRTVDGDEVGGTDAVTGFSVALRDVAGDPVAALADAREVEVDIRRRAPFQRSGSDPASPDEFETVGWTTVVRPFALRYPY